MEDHHGAHRALPARVTAARDMATSPENYRAAAGGYLAEIDRMIREVREYWWALQSKRPPNWPRRSVTTSMERSAPNYWNPAT